MADAGLVSYEEDGAYFLDMDMEYTGVMLHFEDGMLRDFEEF